MKLHRSAAVCAAAVTAVASMLAGCAPAARQPVLPSISEALATTPASYPFSAARHQNQPFDLEAHGYIEEEYLVSGAARVYDWPQAGQQAPQVLGSGPYTTRILVRRPKDAQKFNGTAIVEPLNPSANVDLPIMWAESYPQLIADGYAWVGVTIKPNTIQALKNFDAERYAAVRMPKPAGIPGCSAAKINPLSHPTTNADESGLAWDMLTQIGTLLKDSSAQRVLGRPAQRLYMTGQSQTAAYARTYASLFGPLTEGADGRPLYDAYIFSGGPPWQVPLHQCREDLAAGDPRLITPPAGVPVIEMFAQGDMGSNIESRRPDSDRAPDLFRRYEIPGAAHLDPWEQLSFASEEDMNRARGGIAREADENCTPRDVEPTDFPIRYVFNAAWRHLDAWVREGVAPPRSEPLQIEPGTHAGNFTPAESFVTDAHGNALGGVRTPYVDVPTAHWVGSKSGSFRCFFYGYKYPFDAAKLKSLYGTHEEYVERVKASAADLQAQRWLTPEDAQEIVAEAERRAWP